MAVHRLDNRPKKPWKIIALNCSGRGGEVKGWLDFIFQFGPTYNNPRNCKLVKNTLRNLYIPQVYYVTSVL